MPLLGKGQGPHLLPGPTETTTSKDDNYTSPNPYLFLGCSSALLLPGIELIFFPEVCPGLHSGFSMRTVLAAHRCLGWSPVKTFQCPMLCQQGESMARRPNPKWPEGYSGPQNLLPSTVLGGGWPGATDHCCGMGEALVSGA